MSHVAAAVEAVPPESLVDLGMGHILPSVLSALTRLEYLWVRASDYWREQHQLAAALACCTWLTSLTWGGGVCF